MNVALPPELEKYMQAQIKSGRFRSPEAVVYEGLRLLEYMSSDRPEARALYEAYLIERYRRAEISSGRLGELLGLDHWETEAFLHERGINMLYDMDDLAQDMETFQRLEMRAS